MYRHLIFWHIEYTEILRVYRTLHVGRALLITCTITDRVRPSNRQSDRIERKGTRRRVNYMRDSGGVRHENMLGSTDLTSYLKT